VFRGIQTALVTPLRGGVVDVDAVSRLVRRQVEAGIPGLVVCASTGEGMLLSDGERRLVLETAVRAAAGKCPVVLGISAIATSSAVEQARMASDLGAAGVMVSAPPYVNPGQDGLCAHFNAVADASKVPVILYNVPSRSGVDVSFATVVRLSSHENITAIKEASGDIERVQQILHACAGHLDVLSGCDSLNLSIMVAGGHGAISTSANVVPEKWMTLFQQFSRGDVAAASAIQASLLGLHEALFMESNPGPVKAAMQLLGLASGEVRMPLLSPSRPTLYRLASEIENLGIRIESGALV